MTKQSQNAMTTRETPIPAVGSRIRHKARPEWGVGIVIRIDHAPSQQEDKSPRVTIRFANAGEKTIHIKGSQLELIQSDSDSNGSPGHRNGSSTSQNRFRDEAGAGGRAVQPDDSPLDIWTVMDNSDWLSPVARQKAEEIMTRLPLEARDPFNSLQQRLSFTLDLYRFDLSGRGLIDWAVAQSGLNDPLSRFSRQELEELFRRWALARDSHLQRLLHEARPKRNDLERLLSSATPAARQAVKRIIARR